MALVLHDAARMANRMPMIFLADDDPVLVRGLELALTGRGYAVRTAASGPALLELLERERPDLVLLDLMMPGMSGLEVLERVRARWSALRVVVVTAAVDREVVAEARAGGAAVVQKPFRLQQLVDSIKGCLSGT